MATVIKAAQRVLQMAMKDLDSGTPSHGCILSFYNYLSLYNSSVISTSRNDCLHKWRFSDKQLFRDTPPSDIKNTFQNIFNGSPMPLSWGSHYNYLPFAPPQIKDVFGRKGRYTHVLHPPPSRGAQSSPRILCVDDQTIAQYNLPDTIKEACKRRASPEAQPPDSMYIQGTPYIVVCDSFWDIQVLPLSTRQAQGSKVCPAWDPKTRMPDHRGPSIDDCFAHQALVLIHEGVHFYIQNSLSDWTLPREAYEWPDILSRQASYLRRNPSNYQAYAGMVYSDCQFDESAAFTAPSPKPAPKREKANGKPERANAKAASKLGWQ